MDRSSARRARAAGGTLAPAASSRTRRGRPPVVIDLGDDDEDGSRGGGGGGGSASGRRGGSTPPPAPVVVPAGAVAMRTRSRRMAMQAAVAPPTVTEDEAPRTKRMRKGAEAAGGQTSRRASVSSGEKRRAASKPRASRTTASRARARGRKGKEAEVDEHAEASATDDSDGSVGRSDDASNEASRSGAGNGIDRGGGDRRRATVGNRVEEHRGGQKVSAAVNLNHATSNGVLSGEAEGLQGGGRGGSSQGGGSNVDVDTRGSGKRDLAPIEDVVAGEVAPFEDDYDDEMREEQLVGEVIRAYSNGEGFELDSNGADWEAEDEMGFTDDGEDDDFTDGGDDANNTGDADDDNITDGGDDDNNMDDVDDDDNNMSHADDDNNMADGDHDNNLMDDNDEGGMSEPMGDHAKTKMQELVDRKVGLGGMECQEKGEANSRDEAEQKGEGAPGLEQGSSHTESMDSDNEVEVLNDVSCAPARKASGPAKLPVIPSCVAWRTRSSWGMNYDRQSYNTYFEALSDEPKEEDDDTEVELDEDEDDNDDDSSESYAKDEEQEEREEEQEAERRKLNNGIGASDDDIIDSPVPTPRHDFEWEEVKRPNVDTFRFLPTTSKKHGSVDPVGNAALTERKRRSRFTLALGDPVGNETLTEEQKRSRFTWDLERRKKLKLGEREVHRLFERGLNSDSNSSDSDQNKRNGIQRNGDKKDGKKKKHPLSRPDKKSSQATMLKRQSLLKLLIDKMNGDKNGESSTFDLNPQLKFSFKEMHPLVFSFGDEDPIPVDKPEQDVELDTLWADFDFALESENIGTYYDDEGQEEGNQLNLGLPPVTPCSRGNHDFIVDDEIGIRCRYCSLVNLEIRFMLPSVVSGFADKSWPIASGVKNVLMFNDLYEQAGNGAEQSQDFHLRGTVWDLIPGINSTMYEHQHEAFEFMWTNLVGDIRLDELKHGPKPDVVGGCVICHAPGTGKTRLAIAFIQTYMKVFPDCRPVIIAPRGMLFAWDEEFKKWNVDIPFHIMNTTDYTGKEDRDICSLIKKEHRTEKLTRLVKLLSWNKGHGILGISYGLYTKLTSEKPGCTQQNKVRSILLDNPGLLVLDEGHTPRNDRSVMWKTLGNVKTEKRIILSGTPFQNNFLELYNILCLVRPRFGEMFLTKGKVGRRHHVSRKQRDKFSDKYEKGVWASLTSNVTDDNAEKVRSILKPFVHIHNGNILRTLPGLRESVIILKPRPLQKSIIRKVENIGSGNNFEHEYVISLASTHPSLVTAINMSAEEASVIDKPMLEKLRSNPYEGVKTRFVIEVVRLCEALKEKVLIFSQFIQPLELIKEHLRKFFKWREGKEILQMDGKILPRYRQASIEAFNNPDNESRVLLASTRACCEGISLTGASRVVLLDVVWNPAVGRQAISRAFRIGQKKFVYTYNLITYGTGEGDKYDRQAEKDHLSKLVFSTEDEFNNVRNMLSKAEMELCSKLISEDKVLEELTSHDQLKGMFLKIHYPPTESNIVFTYNQMASELS